MNKIIMVLLLSMAIIPARAQFFKKLKEEASQKMKEKLEMKKAQKIDEQTDKAANKVAAIPDSVVQKTGRKIKSKKEEKERRKTDSAATSPSELIVADSVRQVSADSASKTH